MQTFDFNVVATEAPVVIGADKVLAQNGLLHITGEHLLLVTQVYVVPVSGTGPESSCYLTGVNADNPDGDTDTALTCSFDGVAPGDYVVVVSAKNCGNATYAPPLTITLPAPTP
jgi:hypothetical protein